MQKLTVNVSAAIPEIVEVTREQAISFLKGWIKDALVTCLEENLALDTDQVVFSITAEITDD